MKKLMIISLLLSAPLFVNASEKPLKSSSEKLDKSPKKALGSRTGQSSPRYDHLPCVGEIRQVGRYLFLNPGR